jgi:serine/threonine protein kinase
MRGQLPIGSVLAGYRIVELISEGAGGAVYLAEQDERGERVALKPGGHELRQGPQCRALRRRRDGHRPRVGALRHNAIDAQLTVDGPAAETD